MSSESDFHRFVFYLAPSQRQHGQWLLHVASILVHRKKKELRSLPSFTIFGDCPNLMSSRILFLCTLIKNRDSRHIPCTTKASFRSTVLFSELYADPKSSTTQVILLIANHSVFHQVFYFWETQMITLGGFKVFLVWTQLQLT
jgi:hypothetical protein